MPFHSYIPPSPLSQFVAHIWTVTGPPEHSPRMRIFPNGGEMGLLIHLSRQNLSFFEASGAYRVRAPLLSGAFSKSFLIDPAEFTSVIGVRFKPGAARMFFPLPAHELHNTDVYLGDLYPQEAERLCDQLLSVADGKRQCRAVEAYLLAKLPQALPLHPAVEHAVRVFQAQPGTRAIAAVQSEVGLSHTRFIRLFRENVGLTPKLFCRLQRFRGVVDRIAKGQPVNWAELALDSGYFDQAHLIHDFRAFSGLTPHAYSRREAG